MAFEPPPTQAITQSGSAPVRLQDLRARLAADDGLQLAHQIGIGMRPHAPSPGNRKWRVDRPPSRGRLRRWRRAACDRRWSPAPRWRPSAACGRRSAPGAPCPLRPCTPRRAGPRARRPQRWPHHAGPHRSRPRCASHPCACASSTWPSALLILCAPVCARSSRLNHISAPQRLLSVRHRRQRGGTSTQSRNSAASSSLELLRWAGSVYSRFEEPLEGRHQRLGNVAAAVGTEAALRVGHVALPAVPPAVRRPIVLVHCSSSQYSPLPALRKCCARADTNDSISAGLLRPGASSTPLDTSTPKGRTPTMASVDVRRREAAREDQLGAAASIARRAPVRPPCRCRCAGLRTTLRCV